MPAGFVGPGIVHPLIRLGIAGMRHMSFVGGSLARCLALCLIKWDEVGQSDVTHCGRLIYIALPAG